MKEDKKVLGKGLSALLGEAVEADSIRKPIGYVNKEVVGTRPIQRQSDILMVPIEKIQVNPFQPRLEFDQNALEELAGSIRSLGLIQPITVRRVENGNFQIISGERRFRACTMAEMKLVPAYVREATDEGMLEMALMENLQREDLDPIEIALSLRSLMEECRLTQEQLSGRISKNRASIANYLRLLRLPDKVQHDLRAGLLSVGHAKVLLGVEDPMIQQSLCDLVVSENLTVRDLEQKLKGMAPKQTTAVSDRVKDMFGRKAAYRRTPKGRGVLSIKFSSDAEAEEFLNKLGNR